MDIFLLYTDTNTRLFSKLDPVYESNIEAAAQQLLDALNRFVVALVRPQASKSPQGSLNEKLSANRGESSNCRPQGHAY